MLHYIVYNAYIIYLVIYTKLKAMQFYLRMSHRTPFTIWQNFGAKTKKKTREQTIKHKLIMYIQTTTEL